MRIQILNRRTGTTTSMSQAPTWVRSSKNLALGIARQVGPHTMIVVKATKRRQAPMNRFNLQKGLG